MSNFSDGKGKEMTNEECDSSTADIQTSIVEEKVTELNSNSSSDGTQDTSGVPMKFHPLKKKMMPQKVKI